MFGSLIELCTNGLSCKCAKTWEPKLETHPVRAGRSDAVRGREHPKSEDSCGCNIFAQCRRNFSSVPMWGFFCSLRKYSSSLRSVLEEWYDGKENVKIDLKVFAFRNAVFCSRNFLDAPNALEVLLRKQRI
ncbi:hypothetical protein HBH70_161530 [Parastagonospora nodorum]|nr:hypothetical protein HBI09_195930 [Parastagonospora nodorum]KAH5132507.1 hypothetical protein HBH70_161530 [Parastagonospora nodorum]KAH5257789.1 hypothetical protein HBI70_178590 [Parastagonospora nodorum]KAH5563683.1 hypothetical protein HBI26_179180 [Parastagonospora nodorum]